MVEISFTSVTQKYAPYAREEGDLMSETDGGWGGLTEEQLIDLIDDDKDPTLDPRVRLEHNLAQSDAGCHQRIGIRAAKRHFR